MDEEFESLVVTDPNLIDEGVDISGLRTQTDVSPYLLGNIPDFAGIQYEAFNPRRLSDLMRLYSSGLPAIDTAQIPGAIDTLVAGGGGTGDGGQGTIAPVEVIQPIDTPITTDLTDDQINEFATEDATGVNPFDTDDFDEGMDFTITPVTDVTRSETVLGKPGIEKFDDAETSIDIFDTTPITGGSIPPGEPGGPGYIEPPTPDNVIAEANIQDYLQDIPDEELYGITQTSGSIPPGEPGGPGYVEPAESTSLADPILQNINDYITLTSAQEPTPQVVDVAAAEAAIAKAKEAEQAQLASELQPFAGEPQAVKTILAPDGITYDAVTGLPVSDDPTTRLPQLGSITETDVDVEGNLLQSGIDKLKKLLPENFDLNSALIKTAINASIGKPITLFLDVLKNLLPEQDPRQTALNKFYTTGAGAQYMSPTIKDPKTGKTITNPNYIPGMENYNIVSGGLLNTITGGAAGDPTTYGLQEAYQSRINTIENTLQDKYGLSAQDIADIKAGTFDPEKMDIQTDLIKRLVDLENAKAEEFAMLDEVTDELGDVQQDLTPEDKKADIEIGDAAIAEEIAKQDPTTEAKLEQAEQIQEIKFQKVAQNDNEKQQQKEDTGVAKISENLYETKSGDVYGSAAEAAEKSDNGGSRGGKIVCTMMNESYGFGSFRNKIWMKFHKDLSPEYQRGYHKLFLPLVRIAKKNIIVKKVLEHIAVHSTIDMRQSMRGKTHLLGRIYRKILLPVCYWVGKHG